MESKKRTHKLLCGLWLFLFLGSGFSQTQKAPVLQQLQIKGKLPVKVQALKKASKLKEGLPVTIPQIQNAQRYLLSFLNKKGFLDARMDSIIFNFNKDSSALLLKMFVNPGLPFVVDSLEIKSQALPVAQYRSEIRWQAGEAFDQDRLQEHIKELVRFAAERGYPLTRVGIQLVKIERDARQGHVVLRLTVKEGPKLFIKNVQFRGRTYTRPEVILREINFKPGMLYRQSWIDEIVPRLNRLRIFKTVFPPQLVRADSSSLVLVIEVQEGNATVFDGIVGYVPPPANQTLQRGYFTGLLNLSFRNLLGTGRKLKVYWEKSDRLSENFNFSYQEPWIFNWPLDAGFSFGREVRDTIYTAYDLQWATNLRFSDRLSFFLNFNRHSVNPDSLASVQLGLLKNRIYGLEVGLRYDTRDYPLNPTSGFNYTSSYNLAFKENLGPKWLLERDSVKTRLGLNTVNLHFEWYIPLWKNQVFAVLLSGHHIRGSRLQLSDYFWFGGRSSVRGYRERQFSGYSVGWANLEYRFISGTNSRVFLFSDFGYFKNDKKEQFLRGIGFGMRFETPLGIMGIDYGLARGESFRQGKIHFGLTNQF